MTDQPPQDLARLPLADFIESAAAKTPTPGGGSIAAVSGALGASMFAMAVNYTRGEKFKDVAPVMDATAGELTRARAMFLQLMAEDMAAFAQWQSAWRMDKADPARPEAMRVATATAIAVPQEIAALCVTLLAKIVAVIDKVNGRLLSDVGVAAVTLESAMRAAHYNIRTNLSSLESKQDADGLRAEMAGEVNRAKDLLATIEAKLATKF
ncbi:MAG: cyclodeaminase/cyclohydrolase family protein [Phycisphaerae bacterium]|nr:cyclodeaminase/cyclohydrolase family protein [Phycisphaerae bacterium]